MRAHYLKKSDRAVSVSVWSVSIDCKFKDCACGRE